jgi:hypothetical protein
VRGVTNPGKPPTGIYSRQKASEAEIRISKSERNSKFEIQNSKSETNLFGTFGFVIDIVSSFGSFDTLRTGFRASNLPHFHLAAPISDHAIRAAG